LNTEINLFDNDWWAKRRWHYNKGLLISGISAFICYAVIGEILIQPNNPEYEITLFTVFFQGAAFLFMMIVANIFYFLGALTDDIFKAASKYPE